MTLELAAAWAILLAGCGGMLYAAAVAVRVVVCAIVRERAEAHVRVAAATNPIGAVLTLLGGDSARPAPQGSEKGAESETKESNS